MTEDRASWGVGIVHHDAFDDLQRCLDAIERQTRPPSRVVIYDTGTDPARLAALAPHHPNVRFVAGDNRGYAGGANRALEVLLDGASLDHVLVMNPDVELEALFGERLLAALEGRADVAIAGGKLLRRDRRTIDSAGIEFPRHRRPRDRGSETPDRGQYDAVEAVEGASGAALWIRVAALEALRIEGELFDEAFFAYHEDTDLCWRARRLGFGILYVPDAVAVHARGWQRHLRAEIPVAIRRHSFKNHYLQLVKNETGRGLLRNAPWLLTWEILRLGFVLLRDRPLLPAYAQAARALPRAWRWRGIIRARAREIGQSASGRP